MVPRLVIKKNNPVSYFIPKLGKLSYRSMSRFIKEITLLTGLFQFLQFRKTDCKCFPVYIEICSCLEAVYYFECQVNARSLFFV